MVAVDPKKTVRIQVDPIDQSPKTHELAQYVREELRKRSKIEDIDL